MNSLSPQNIGSEALSAPEQEFVHFFVRLASALNLPRSIGEIFGLLFASKEPIPFDTIVARLGISKGSVSQGLKFLTKMGAVKVAYVPRDRRSFYEAETSMRRLIGGALNESARPHLEGNHLFFEKIGQSIEDNLNESGDPDDHLRSRLTALKSWNEKALQMLPLLEFFFSAPIPKSLLETMRQHGKTESEP